MRVCHLTSVHSHTDTRIFVKECSTLAEKNLEVFLIAPNAPTMNKNGVNIIGVKRDSSSRIKRMLKTTNNIYKKALEINADVYHFHDPELMPIGIKLKGIGKKVIYDVHEDLPRQIFTKNWIPELLKKPISIIVEKYEEKVAKKMDGIITATEHIKKRFVKYNKNVETIYNFPSLKEMDFDFLPWEEKNGICYVGGITKVRGVFEMIEAAGLVNNDKDIPLKLGGPIEDKIKVDIEKHKYWKYVDYKGVLSREEVKEVLNSSEIGLVTLHPTANYIDALPVKMFEYMSASIPVICSNFPIWRKIIEKNKCGIYVNPKNPMDIAKAINYLLDNPKIAEKMGKNGREAIEMEYNWEKEGEKLLSFYQIINKY